MRRLYDLNKNLVNGKNYIYGNGNHAFIMGLYFKQMNIPFDGFAAFDVTESVMPDKEVISIQQVSNMSNANILITESKWQKIYDSVYEYVDASRIYVNTTWIPRNIPCNICGNPLTFSGCATFVPFLVERMFLGEEKATLMMHCPRCGMYYSYYRPTEEEIGRLYTDYRDEHYQKQRQKYEPKYTKEYNESLYNPKDGGKERIDKCVEFMEGIIDFELCENILDFGGDKGQFIPNVFSNASKYVYEISGTDVVNGVKLITESGELNRYKWDVILCNNVMEHLSDVRGTFTDLVSYMSNNTFLYIEVPFEEYMEDAEISGIHEHINFFREKTFYTLARQYNLKVVKCETTDIIRCLLTKELKPDSK